MRSLLTRVALFVALLLPAPVFAQASLTGTVHDASGARAAGRHGRSLEPGADREDQHGRDRRQRPVPHHRPAARHLLADVHAAGLQHRQARQHRADRHADRSPFRSRCASAALEETDHRDRRVAGRRRADRRAARSSCNSRGHRRRCRRRAPRERCSTPRPASVVDTNGLALSPTMTFFNAHSSTINSTSVAGEGRMTVNGFTVAAARSGGVSSYVYDTPNAEEVTVVVGGGLGESDIGGPVMNIIPRSGGNMFSGSAFLNIAGEWSRGNNLTDELKALNPNLQAEPGHHPRLRRQRIVRRPDQARPPLVLRQLPRRSTRRRRWKASAPTPTPATRRDGTGSARRSTRASCRTVR